MAQSHSHTPIRWPLAVGALLGLTGVILGAYGAHGLQATAAQQASWATAVQYQLVHALALLIIGVWSMHQPRVWLGWAAGLMSAGVVLFSGSIYGLVLDGPRVLGPVTPLGGVALILGWLALLIAGLRDDG